MNSTETWCRHATRITGTQLLPWWKMSWESNSKGSHPRSRAGTKKVQDDKEQRWGQFLVANLISQIRRKTSTPLKASCPNQSKAHDCSDSSNKLKLPWWLSPLSPHKRKNESQKYISMRYHTFNPFNVHYTRKCSHEVTWRMWSHLQEFLSTALAAMSKSWDFAEDSLRCEMSSTAKSRNFAASCKVLSWGGIQRSDGLKLLRRGREAHKNIHFLAPSLWKCVVE